jgi:hypothetical protein
MCWLHFEDPKWEYHSSDKIKENKMGGKFSTQGCNDKRVGLKNLPVASKEKRMQKIGRDGRIILKRILKK